MPVNPAASSPGRKKRPGKGGGSSAAATDHAPAPPDDDVFDGQANGGQVTVGRIVTLSDPGKDRECAFLPRTDLGNAERFAVRFGHMFRFCPEIGWFAWDGRRWCLLSEEKDKTPARVMQAVYATVRGIGHEADLVAASGVPEPASPLWDASQKLAHDAQASERLDHWVGTGNARKLFSDMLAKWAKASESASRINAIPPLVKSVAGMVIAPGDLDRDRMAINCLNGTLRFERKAERRSSEEVAAGKSEWRMGPPRAVLHPHRRDDLITKLANVEFNPRKQCAKWTAFLAKVQPEPAMRRFLLQWGGLSLTGEIGEQKLAFFWGSGSNGKGTWVETVAHIAGDYAGSTQIETFLDQGVKKRGDQASPDLARLPGVRFLRVSEPSTGATLNEGLVKMVTGGDPVDARHLNKSFFTFLPEFKITISGNNKPKIKDKSDGIWRRMQMVPWSVQVPKEERDRTLPEQLRGEADGIFAQLVLGILDWLENGLIEPDEVRMATERYRGDEDDVGRFLAACCEVGGDPKAVRVRSSLLHEMYMAWARQAGGSEIGLKRMKAELETKGFSQVTSNGVWWERIRALVSVDEINAGNWGGDVSAAGGASASGDPFDPAMLDD